MNDQPLECKTAGARPPMALWVLPILLVSSLASMLWASLPLWQAFNLDPDYYYLLNGLRLVEGLSPTDVSHPGTPIQVIIALVIRAMHPLTPTAEIVDAVLADPERPLILSALVLHLLAGWSLWVSGRAAWAWGGMAPALLVQSSPFLARIIVKMALHPKPEPMMVVAAALLAAAAFAMLREDRPKDRHAILAGLVMGFGIACKIHFVALGVVPLLLLDFRRLVIYGTVTITAFALFFAPALGSLDIWLDWLRRISMGAGAYGAGPQTVIDPARFLKAFWHLFSGKWAYTVSFTVALVMLAIAGRKGRLGDRRVRLLAGLVAAQAMTQLLISKQPAPHYMVPPLMLTGAVMAILWSLGKEWMPPLWHRRVWTVLALALIAGGTNAQWKQRDELARWSRDTASLPMERFASCAKIYFDAASAKSFAFQRGDMNALARYSPKLATIMPPDEYSWFIFDHTWWKQGLMQWNQPMELDRVLAAYPCAVFRGNQDIRLRDITQPRRFDDSCTVGEETVFTLGVRCDGSKP